jgi:hypothetical protein
VAAVPGDVSPTPIIIIIIIIIKDAAFGNYLTVNRFLMQWMGLKGYEFPNIWSKVTPLASLPLRTL